LGEIQSTGNYAIGPNCLHKSGNRYKIINDAPIAEIDYQLILEIIKPLRTKKKDDRPVEAPKHSDGHHSLAEVELSRIAWPTGNVQKSMTERGVEYHGVNPFHGSKGGDNFSINTTRGVWVCRRCSSGGGWRELLAVKEGIIRCDQAGHIKITNAQYREIYRRAEELGLIKKQVVEAPTIEINLDTEELESIPRKIPDGDMIVLIAPPRTGKTHAVVQWLKDSGNGNYITHTHAIVEHAIKIAKELGMSSIVWMIGINQPDACIHSKKQDCMKCPLAHTNENHFDLQMKAERLLKEKGILTAKDVPRDMCPYHVLKLAEKSARYCFTVVNNINRINSRGLTILDEEPVLSHFYATSIKIASNQKSMGVDGYKNYIKKSNGLQSDLDQILNHRKKPALKEYATIIVFNITYLTYHTETWESTFELKKDLPSYQRSYL
jgi:hypothetical protein